LIVLVVAITGSFPEIDPSSFHPFMPRGWTSVGFTFPVLFWCFIGWEAVSNMSQEFKDPKRDAIRGTIVAAIIVSVIYFLTALVTVGTRSYGQKMTDASLVYIIRNSFGTAGAIVAGFAALFVCVAPAIAYIGATSRLAYSLSENGYAPKVLSRVSKRYNTPLGGLIFLATCFTILITIFSTRIVSLTTLIQIPNAAFIITYIGTCAAGIKLLKGNTFGTVISVISLTLSVIIFLFSKWTVLYPVVITAVWMIYMVASRKPMGIAGLFKHKRQ